METRPWLPQGVRNSFWLLCRLANHIAATWSTWPWADATICSAGGGTTDPAAIHSGTDVPETGMNFNKAEYL
jgi:hypothetical protein